MSLTPNGAGYSAEGYRCFYCDKPVHDPAIEWMGGPSQKSDRTWIYLHPVCVVEFCLRLLRDVHEWECTTKSELLARQFWGSVLR